MWSTARNVAAGDLVIVYQTRDSLLPLVVSPGSTLNTRFGSYRHNDLLGIPYGSKVPSSSRSNSGYIHILRPTPHLWTLALPHRTQILYLADIALVLSGLDIRPGKRVIEAGTGSGSFSHAVAGVVGTKGKVYSYEFHKTREEKARGEFEAHGIGNIISLEHRNVCKDGFGLEDHVDAVFLDLPAPWEAVAHAKNALRKDLTTHICCFSPCMEQVLRTVAALNDAGFTEITMYETLLCPHDVHQLPPPPSIRSAVERLKLAEQKREEKRVRQVEGARARARERSQQGGDDAGEREKAKLAQLAQGEQELASERDQDEHFPMDVSLPLPVPLSEQPTEKRKNREGEDMLDNALGEDNTARGEGRSGKRVKIEGGAAIEVVTTTTAPSPLPSTSTSTSISPPSHKINLSKPLQQVRGHTAYLTFACMVPDVLDKDAKADDSEPLEDPEGETENGWDTKQGIITQDAMVAEGGVDSKDGEDNHIAA